MPSPWLLVLLGALTAFFGAVGGIGGATLLVPLLLAMGLDPLEAAPLGLIAVASTSLAASVRQLEDGLVHHRLGLTVESTAAVGTVAGALASTAVPQEWLARTLGLGALAGAVAILSRRGVRNLPDPTFVQDSPGEWPGTLGGTYHHGGASIPYSASRVPQALVVCLFAGAISGMAGVGGGFLKVPSMSEIMRVPIKVAAATSTFTLGISAAVGLLVFGGQGRIDAVAAAGTALGALAGATAGARTQSRLPATFARITTGSLLVVVAVVVLVRSR